MNHVFRTILLCAIALICLSAIAGGDSDSELLRAARTGDIALVRTRLDSDEDIKTKDQRGRTALYIAIENRHGPVALFLIEKGADVKAQDNIDETPLLVCVRVDLPDVAQRLIDKGADVNATNLDGCTPLHEASLKGAKEIAALLIAKGADVNARDMAGRTPLHWTAGVRYPRDWQPQKGHADVAELLVRARAEVNARDKTGATPLHYCGGKANLDVAKVLLSNGADSNATSGSGLTPLQWTVYYQDVAPATRRQELIGLLISRGAAINRPTATGRTVLDLALLCCADDDKIPALIEKHRGMSAAAILAAAEAGNAAKLEALLGRESMDGMFGNYRQTMLHRAAAAGQVNLAKLLLSKGANVNARDFYGQTPLDLAKDRGMIALLRQHGGKTSTQLDQKAGN